MLQHLRAKGSHRKDMERAARDEDRPERLGKGAVLCGGKERGNISRVGKIYQAIRRIRKTSFSGVLKCHQNSEEFWTFRDGWEREVCEEVKVSGVSLTYR